jgi:hypothetical protein
VVGEGFSLWHAEITKVIDGFDYRSHSWSSQNAVPPWLIEAGNSSMIGLSAVDVYVKVN